MSNLKKAFKKFLNYFLDINFLILLLTLAIFIITFFSKKGILLQSIYLYKEKKIIYENIKKTENEIINLKTKINLLKHQNKEITEIENYNFKKKIPYEKYEIINIE
jgi:hypothetical protein